jgi:hypothetical protein
MYSDEMPWILGGLLFIFRTEGSSPTKGITHPPPPPPPRADPESIKSDLAEKIERIYRRVGEEQSLVEAGTTPRELIDNAYR